MLIFLLIFLDTGFDFKLEQIHFYEKENTPFLFSYPGCIIYTNEKYFILDSGEGVIQFDKNGLFETKIYGIGQGPEEISPRTPFMVHLPKNRIMVPDTFNGRLLYFDTHSREYSVKKDTSVTFAVNGASSEDDVWLACLNGVVRINTGSGLKAIPLVGKHDSEQIFILTRFHEELLVFSLFLERKKDELIYYQRSGGEKFIKKSLEFISTDEIDEIATWRKKTRVPVFFTGIMSVGDNTWLSSKMPGKDGGSLVFRVKPDKQAKPLVIKELGGVIRFCESGNQKYVIDGEDARIFRVIHP